MRLIKLVLLRSRQVLNAEQVIIPFGQERCCAGSGRWQGPSVISLRIVGARSDFGVHRGVIRGYSWRESLSSCAKELQLFTFRLDVE